MSHHVLGCDTLGGIFIMCAAGGMNVMIAGIPSQGSHVDPALKLDAHRLGWFLFGNDKLELRFEILWAP